MSVGERIKRLRKFLGLTQKEFGTRIGKSLRTIQDWEAGRSRISDHTLRLISSIFGVSYEWLKTGQGEMWEKRESILEEIIEKAQRKFLQSKIKVPVVRKVGAGFPHSHQDIEVVSIIFFDKNQHLKEGKVFAVQVNEDSMYPSLAKGDYVLFQAYEEGSLDIPNRKIVVVRNHSGELFVKRLLKINDTVLLAADNPKYPPIFPQQAKLEGVQVVGVAVKIVKEFEV